MNARAQVSRGPAATPGAGSFKMTRPAIVSAERVPVARENTALVPPATTVTASAVSVISGRYAPPSGAAGTKHFACSPESATWLRATTQPFFAQSVSSLVRKSTSTNSSAPGAVRDIASASPGIVKRQRESGSRAGGTNAPTSTTAPSARSRQRPS